MFLSNRYTQLLISLIVLIVASPFLLKVEMNFPVVSFLFLVIVLLTLRTLTINRMLFVVIALLAISAFVLELFFNFHAFRSDKKLISVITISSFAIFIGISILIMIQNLFSQKEINADSVRGGISVFLLIGCFWGIVFELIAVLDPGAFVLVTGHGGGDIRYLLFYFSFTTLTTVSFGDILPASEFARVFSALEGISGVLFLAVFVAQLVSLHVFHKTVMKHSNLPTQPKGE